MYVTQLDEGEEAGVLGMGEEVIDADSVGSLHVQFASQAAE